MVEASNRAALWLKIKRGLDSVELPPFAPATVMVVACAEIAAV